MHAQENEITSLSFRARLGQHGEHLIAQHLENNGYVIVTRNFRVRSGEIDLIARKQSTLCFVEVKTRSHPQFPITQVVTYAKQKRIVAAAQEYLRRNSVTQMVYRFDVATVDIHRKNTIRYIEHAFAPQEYL